MNTPEIEQNSYTGIGDDKGEKGTAIVIALFVLALIGVFVALALSRTASEAAGVGNETSEARTLYAAQGGLETMTRNFNKIFETKLNPTAADIALVRNGDVVPGLSAALGGDYIYNQGLLCVRGISPDCVEHVPPAESTVVLSDGDYSGLYAIRDSWRLQSTATAPDGTELELTRNIFNNRIPIFQFGIFYDDDLELYRPPKFSFGGRVHSNGNFFVSPFTEGIYFNSRVTAHRHIVTQSWRNWHTGDNYSGTYIKDADGVDQQLLRDRGSVLNGSPSVFTNPDLPPSVKNPNWTTHSEIFDGNLQSEVPELKLPLKVVDADVANPISLIEMIKRGKKTPDANGGDLISIGAPGAVPNIVPVVPATADNDILRSERFANKPGIRISLADSKEKLPGCASGIGTAPVAGPCGVRLDGHYTPGDAGIDRDTGSLTLHFRSRGYQPKAMKLSAADAGFGYVPTRVNGERLSGSYANGAARQVWIKIETVGVDDTTNQIVTRDITQEILSLGVTEPPPNGITIDGTTGLTKADNGTASSPSLNIRAITAQTFGLSTYPDSRSIIKLQRFAIPATNPSTGTTYQIPNYNPTPATNKFVRFISNHNIVVRYTNATATNFANNWCQPCAPEDLDPNGTLERFGHLKRTTAPSDNAIVPFPIKMFDSREGLYYDERSKTYYTDANFENYSMLSRNGVMSMVDIDVANLRRFLRGDFNGLFPVDTPFEDATGDTLKNTDVPVREGWVLYVSDRRGDFDFDGEFDMEDVYGAAPGNDGTRQPGEDVNENLFLDRRYGTESERYRDSTLYPDRAAVNDHSYYRRGVRLINGTTIPGIYDAAASGNTKGFTVASENGIYVQGNYNATGLTMAPPGTVNSPYNHYAPFNTNTHIPASVVADGVTILSNAWNDSQSFTTALLPTQPSQSRVASETTMRFAMISGDTIATRRDTPNQGSSVNGERMNGGVHNFKRFLEHWTGQRLNYSGSLINLYYSRNQNGAFKCCRTVYNPPTRNWVFDSTFLDPGRLPPGTPFFQYVQTTGFQRSTD